MKQTLIHRLVSVFLLVCLALMPTLSVQAESDTDVFALFEQVGLDLSPYEGKAIFMNFFTQWCGYCMQEMPDIKNTFDTYSPDELEIILIHVWNGEGQEASDEVVAKYGLEEMNVFEDTDLAVTQMVGLQGYPASLFIDKEGNLVVGYNYMITEDIIEETMIELDVSKIEE